ncbi:hypothetical protein [Candidatus Binatus sp.]|uniref:hypothetical protein n=1 Tax=Candidatus Binatus sp. TaxID=2811406 RepID=UPI003C51DFE3
MRFTERNYRQGATMGKVISLDRWRAEKQEVHAPKTPTAEHRERDREHEERMRLLHSVYGKQIELEKGRPIE